MNPFGYNTFQQYFGEPDLDFSSNLYGLFVQDDWRLSDSLKVLYGLRYDLYDVPAPNASAPFETSRDFVVDKNNWAPRLGVVWSVGGDRRTVHPRQQRRDVRPGAAGQLRAGAHQRRHQHAGRGHLPADHPRRAGLSRRCCRPAPAPYPTP